jgi:hypothetical protein
MASEDPMKPNILYSWAYLRKIPSLLTWCEKDMASGHRVLIDSGAFTNHTEKRRAKELPIKMDEYIAACRGYFKKWAWNYIQLDVVQNPEETAENLEVMLAAKLKPMPVLVMGAEFEIMPKLVRKSKEGAVCVAGGVRTRMSYAAHRYQQAYKHSAGKAKIHALGFARIPQLFQLPIASSDVSSWKAGGRFGRIGHYSRLGGMRLLLWKKLKGDKEILRGLARAEVPLDMMSDHKSLLGMRGPGTLYTVNSYISFAEHCEQLGVKFFFAVASVDWRLALDGVNHTRQPDGSFNYPKALDKIKEIRSSCGL